MARDMLEINRLSMNDAAWECRRLMLQSHENTIRETSSFSFHPIPYLLNKINATREMKNDEGYTYAADQYFFFSDHCELSRFFVNNIYDTVKIFDDRGDAVSFQQNENMKNFCNTLMIDSQYNLEDFAEVLNYRYSSNQFKARTKEIESNINKIREAKKTNASSSNIKLTKISRRKSISTILFIDNAMIGYNKHSYSHKDRPRMKIHFVMGHINIDQEGNAELYGMKRNSMKLLMNGVPNIDDEIEYELPRHHVLDDIHAQQIKDDDGYKPYTRHYYEQWKITKITNERKYLSMLKRWNNMKIEMNINMNQYE